MGSSGKTKTKGMAGSSGGLVWVRRRNGSWWPGRVLSPDELPETCLVTPRSGTPVKLLGREDASVDWYNLEKSKRIKAFRCGEYDRCIEKAKASAASPSKGAVKYARRDDAILHALEIESARQSKDQADICSTVHNPSYEEDGLKELPTTLLPDEETDHATAVLISSKNKSVLGYELSQSGVSFDETDAKEQSSQGTRRKTPNDSEDDETGGIKRMRGLEDIGVGVESSAKRKRSLVANVHEYLKKKSRRRQLTKVLESASMVTVPVMCEPVASPTESFIHGVSDSKVSGLESNESKGSFSVLINNNSDSTGENGTSFNASEHANDALIINCRQKEIEISSTGLPDDDFSNRLFDVPLVGEDLTGFTSVYVSCATQKPQVVAGAQSSQSSQVETVPMINEELNASGSTSSGATNTDVIDSRIKEGSSKWMLKGKRNLRNAAKSRKHGFKKTVNDDKSNEAVLEAGFVGASLVSDNCAFLIKSKPMTENHSDEVQGCGTHILRKEHQMMVPTSELATPQRSQPYRRSRYAMNPKYQSSDFTPRVYEPDSNLYDINLKVQASYHPNQHVPYISLMSKLTGQPIIGHPITVEALDGGFRGLLISSSECHSEDVYGLQGLDTVYKGRPNRRGGKICRKRPALQPRYSTSKLPKSRKSGLLSKKIRKLSSITGSHKHNVEEKKPVIRKVKGPSISCVPLKVVFSRINAAIN